MLDPSGLYEINKEFLKSSRLENLCLLVGFTGFSEAGKVAFQISQEILDNFSHEIVAVFDVDQIFDYRMRRPSLMFSQNRLENYKPPTIKLYLVEDSKGQPFLFLYGVEPSYQWERFVYAVIGLVERFKVRLVTWVHSIALPVPHTRPIGVTVHGNRLDLVSNANSWQSVAQILASVGHLLELRLFEKSYDVVGYVVHVPHYLADSQYPDAAITALEHLASSTGIFFFMDRIRLNAQNVSLQLEEQLKNSPEIKQVVLSLEERYDAFIAQNDVGAIPDGDQLAADFEEYLANYNKNNDFEDGFEG